MPRPASVRPSRLAASDTTLSARSISTWSGVSSGVRQELQKPSPAACASDERQRHQQPLALDGGEHELHQLLERLHLRPAEFVDRAGRARCAVDRVGDRRRRRRRRTPAGIASAPPPISGSAGDMRASAAKRLKKSSSGPNTIDGRMIVAPGMRRQHRLLALRLGAGVERRANSASAPMRRDVHHARAVGGRGLRHLLGAVAPARRRSAAGRARTGCRPD